MATATLNAAEAAEFRELARQVVENAPPPTFAYLDIGSVRVDSEYQRDLSQRRVERMVKEFDPHRFQPIEVSKRADGSHWCIEGQHRLAAARRLGMHVIAAMVHVGLTSTDEALLFWMFQRDRRALSAWDSFEARLHGQETVAVGVDATCRDAGVTYGRGTNFDVQALVVLETVYRMGGKDLLGSTLRLIQRIWPVAHRRFDGNVIGGLGLVLHQYRVDPAWSEDRLVTVLSGVTPSYIVAEVKQARGGLASGADRVDYTAGNLIRGLYNRRLGKARQLPPLTSRIGRALPGEAGLR